MRGVKAIFNIKFDLIETKENNYIFLRFCGQQNEATRIENLEKKFKTELAEWTHIVAVREPIERFISGFTDKCLIEKRWEKRPSNCNRCKTNVTCFIEKEYIRMSKFVKGEEINSFDDQHFFPQNWRCQFYSYYRFYKILKYSVKETDEFFKEFF
uniref:Sulfotransferase family protein n=1 Tax=Panagrolaimus davidi TaxID=227884 RepID=A0A914P6L7_9BILA